MEFKKNDRGIYLFFPTDGKAAQRSYDELEKLRVLTAGYWSWEMWEAVREAHKAALDVLQCRKEKRT